MQTKTLNELENLIHLILTITDNIERKKIEHDYEYY